MFLIKLIEFYFFELSQQLPGFIKRIIDTSIRILPLGNKFLFKLFQEVQVFFILCTHCFLTDDRLHSLFVFSFSVEGIKLIRNSRVILSSVLYIYHSPFDLLLLSQFFNFVGNNTLHDPRQRWQHINRWVYIFLEELSLDVDLSFSDITSKIGNWMSNIVIWHC